MTSFAPSVAQAGLAARSLDTEAGVRGSLLLLLLAAPWPLGSVDAGVRASLFALVGAVFAIATVVAWQRGRPLPLPPGTFVLAAFALLAVAQCMPLWPLPTVAWLEGVPAGHGSLVPVRTWNRLGELLALFLCHALAVQWFGPGRSTRRAVGVLLAACAGFALHGLLVLQGVLPRLGDEQTLTVLVGTFVNRNHTAHLLAMGAVAGLGLLVAGWHRGSAPALRLLQLVAIAAAVVGVVATRSRGGAVALAVGVVLFAFLVAPWTKRRRVAFAGSVAALLLLAAAALPADWTGRFAAVGEELQGQGARPDIWTSALRLWRLFPWFGTGLGTFGDLSPLTQSAAVPGRVEHAHAEPLEALVETGVVGALLLALFALVWTRHVVTRCFRQTDRARAALQAGLIAAVVASAVQALVEFPWQIPANALWTAAFAGLAVAAGRSSRSVPYVPRHLLALGGLAVLVALAGAGRACWHAEQDGLAALAQGQQALASDVDVAAERAQAALAGNAFSPRAHRLAGDALLARDPAAAQRAYDRCEDWTNPAERWRTQLAIALHCVAEGASEVAAARFARGLPTWSADVRRQAFVALHELLPIGELAGALLPREPRQLVTEFAETLLRRGDFAGRERFLAERAGRAVVPLTLRDDVFLRDVAVDVQPVQQGTQAGVQLQFALPEATPPVPLVLRCDGPGAGAYRSFEGSAQPFAWTFELDRTFPPGRYTIALDFRADAPHAPLQTFELPEPPVLALAPGALPPVATWHWSTGEPGRRQRPERGLPLRVGDALWRRVTTPALPTALLVRTARATRLGITLDGEELPGLRSTPTVKQRVPLPTGRAGVLAVRALGDDEPLVLELTLETEAPR